MQSSPLPLLALWHNMSDFIGSSFANLLRYIWAFIVSFFVEQPTPSLPLIASRESSRAEVQQTLNSSQYTIEMGHSEKEQFLRHPSLRSKRKGRHKDTSTETRNRWYGPPSISPSGSSIQYFNSLFHRPRAGSITIPVVIITPSTPTGNMFHATEHLLPSLSSPLDLADAIAEPLHHPPISICVTQPVFGGAGEMSLAPEKQVSLLPDVENDISDMEFDSWTTSVAQVSLGEDAADQSLFLPEALRDITFEPILCAPYALSAVSDMLCDVPAWSGVETMGVGMPSYFTSTPPRRRGQAGTKLRDIENNCVEAAAPLGSPGRDNFCQYAYLTPYPDVFDLDMYYDPNIPLRNKLKKPCSRDYTFKNTLPPESDGSIDPPLSEKLPSDGCEGCGTIISSVISISSPVTYHQRPHDFKPCHDNISQSPPTRSLLENISSPTPSPLSSILPQLQHRRIPPDYSFDSHYTVPLNESTNTSLRTSATCAITTSSNSTVYSIEDTAATSAGSYIAVSTRSQRSCSSRWSQRPQTSSSDSETGSDAGSVDALNARLKEACDKILPATFTQVDIWEPVPF